VAAIGAESLPVLNRREEGFDHLSVDVVAVELIQFRQPEIKPGVVIIRNARQATRVLSQLKRAIAFKLLFGVKLIVPNAGV